MNQWVLITGAAGGLGKAFAVECASRGWNLYLTDLCEQSLNTLAEGLRNTYGVMVDVAPCDLTDAASRADLYDRIACHNHKFSMLVNVAGLDYEGSFYERTSSQIRAIVRLNIEGTLDVTHALLGYRDPLAAFRIITIASLAAFFPMPIKATYAASKRFLLDFSLALREEVKPLGATVTVVCPAGLPTTRECIEAIEAQGLFGQLTTQNTGTVATGAIDAALHGQTLYIPGFLNRVIQMIGSMIPAGMLAAVIGWRWRAAHSNSPMKVSRRLMHARETQ